MKNLLLSILLLVSGPALAQQAAGRIVEGTIFPGSYVHTNYVKNPSAFKNAAAGTATSSATLTRDTSAGNKLDGVASFICDSSALNGYCEWQLDTINVPDTTGRCNASLMYKGDASLYQLQITDTTTAVASSVVLSNAASWTRATVSYTGQASASIRFTQTVAGTGAAVNVGKVTYSCNADREIFSSGSVPFSNGSILTQNNSKLFWDNTNFRLGINTTTPTRLIEVVDEGTSSDGVRGVVYNNTVTAGPIFSGRKALGTAASPSAVTAGSFLFSLNANGYNGSAFQTTPPAQISFVTTETFTGSAAGTDIRFFTTPTGSTTRNRVAQITNDGALELGTSTNAIKIYPGTPTSYSLTLPSAQGGAGTVLTNNGSGTLSWGSAAATPTYQKNFDLMGPYAAVIGTSANDRGERFICNQSSGCKITKVCMYVKTKGSSGTTTLDLKYATKAAPNTFATIFSTAPAATTTITNGEYKCTGDSGTGWTAPVMSPNPFLMGSDDTLRLDVTGVMTDSEDAGLVIYYQSQ